MYTFNIYPILDANSISVADLSKATGIGYTTLISYCSGKSRTFKFEYVERICNVLNCTMQDIITHTNRDMTKVETLVRKQQEKIAPIERSTYSSGSSLQQLRENNRLRFD